MNATGQLWAECLVAFNIESATLLTQSLIEPFQRAYAANGYVYKLVAPQCETTSKLRQQDFAAEFDILKHCSGIQGIPSAITHLKTEGFEALVMEHLPGEPLANLNVSWPRLFFILSKLSIILFKLSPLAVSQTPF